MLRLPNYSLGIIINTFDVYRVSSNHNLSHTLEENIMSHGAMDVLISDYAHAATSQKVKDILHMYCIESCTSDPHQQHQNYPKCCIGHIKDIMNHVLTFLIPPVISGCYASCMYGYS